MLKTHQKTIGYVIIALMYVGGCIFLMSGSNVTSETESACSCCSGTNQLSNSEVCCSVVANSAGNPTDNNTSDDAFVVISKNKSGFTTTTCNGKMNLCTIPGCCDKTVL